MNVLLLYPFRCRVYVPYLSVVRSWDKLLYTQRVYIYIITKLNGHNSATIDIVMCSLTSRYLGGEPDINPRPKGM